MKAAHTPGPWNAVNNDAGTALEIWDDDGQMIANVQPQDPPAVEHANAALIAAVDVDADSCFEMAIARAAIAKAEGRS